MSDYSSLKATINANIKANNNHEITGAITNSVLNAMVDSLGAGYQYKGVATPTNPGSVQTPDYKCFYIATTPGTYTNLGGLVVADGEVAILKYDTSWTKEVTGVATADQVSQLGQEINYQGVVSNSGFVRVSDGEIVSHPLWFHSDFISIEEFVDAKLLGNDSVANIAFYSEKNLNNYISGISATNGTVVVIHKDEIQIPAAAKYIVISDEPSISDGYYTCNKITSIAKNVDEKIASIEAELNEELKKGGEVSIGGWIRKADGELVSNPDWFHSVFIPVEAFVEAKLTSNDSVANIAFYERENLYSYISGVSGSGGVVVIKKNDLIIPATAKYIVISDKPSESNGYYTYKIIEELEQNVNSLKLNPFTTKMAHFSFDDVCLCLEDLTENKDVYTSIFDNPFFLALKQMHEEYGMVFSLYTFWEKDGWELTSCTTKFASQFSANSDWLKFGPHTMPDWDTWLTTMLGIVGSVECIDQVPRLHGFAGTLQQCISARDSNLGALGFLAPDEITTIGYYLDPATSQILFKRGKYFDAATQLYFFSTLVRIEGQTPAITLGNLLLATDAYRANNAILFTHEYQLYTNGAIVQSRLNEIKYCGTWCKEHNYVWNYPMNKIKNCF